MNVDRQVPLHGPRGWLSSRRRSCQIRTRLAELAGRGRQGVGTISNGAELYSLFRVRSLNMGYDIIIR